MAIVVGRNNRCMLSLLDEDIEPLRTDVGDKKAAECVLRDYDLIGKTRIILKRPGNHFESRRNF